MRPRALRQAVLADLDMVQERDPSILNRTEALLHPGLLAIWGYRVAHQVHERGWRRTARVLSNGARVLSGSIEIHPGATIGRRFFIDHGAGVVIGETAVIGDDVTLFHQVTLGSVGWWHDEATPSERRHPRLGDRVVVGANATILGGITVGSDSTIGSQALVLKDVPAQSRVLAPVARTRVPAAPLPATSGQALRPVVRRPAASSEPARQLLAATVPFPTW